MLLACASNDIDASNANSSTNASISRSSGSLIANAHKKSKSKSVGVLMRSEERAFWLLCVYVEDVCRRDFFSRPPSGMNGFAILLAVFRRLSAKLLPEAQMTLGLVSHESRENTYYPI